jgi:hypothetical protein
MSVPDHIRHLCTGFPLLLELDHFFGAADPENHD